MNDEQAEYLAWLEGRLRENVAAKADQLRGIADRIERIAGQDGVRTESIAGQVIHELTWGFANLDLQGLVQRSNDYSEANGGGK